MLNVVAIQGRLTADVELKTTQSGKTVTTFTLAVQRNKENTDFIDCVAWHETAKFIYRYFDKGQQMIVSGDIRTRTWEKDGRKHKATEINVTKADFCGSKSESTAGAVQNTNTSGTANYEDIPDNEDLPF